MDYYEIPTWKDYQHYKDRDPPWIKLHFSILSSPTWVMLDDASRTLAIACMLIASRNHGKVPSNPDYLSRVAYLNTVNFKPLIDIGFLVYASDCKQMLATASKLTQEERREYKSTEKIDTESSGKQACPPCPIDEIILIYHETLPTSPRVMVRTPTRDKQIQARWKQFFTEGDFNDKEGGIGCFRWYFDQVKNSKFLTGQTDKPFFADLEWLTKASNFAKVIEGKYGNR